MFERLYVAADEPALRRELENQDLLLLDARRRSTLGRELARALRLKSGVSPRDFLLFNQELRALLRAGLPILPSLDILLERRKNPVFKRALNDIRDRVRSGESLSDAFAREGNLFPPLYAASLASGERSGELPGVLQRYVAYTQMMLAVRRKVVSALIYPTILLTLSIGLVLVLLFFVLPRFKPLLTDFGVELPLPTRILLAVADFAATRWPLLLGALIATVAFTVWWGRTERGRLALDKLRLRLPVLGPIIHDYAQNRFTRTLATLQAGGIHLVTSLDLAARAVGNKLFEREMLRVRDAVREGRALWESLEVSGLIADITVQMVKVGESTGALVEMLNNASDFTDEEVDARLTRMVSLIEPIMLVCMAIVVGFMLMAMYLPLIQIYGQSRM